MFISGMGSFPSEATTLSTGRHTNAFAYDGERTGKSLSHESFPSSFTSVPHAPSLPLPPPSHPPPPPPTANASMRHLEVKASLENLDLWRKFHSIGTEMIITKMGRLVTCTDLAIALLKIWLPPLLRFPPFQRHDELFSIAYVWWLVTFIPGLM